MVPGRTEWCVPRWFCSVFRVGSLDRMAFWAGEGAGCTTLDCLSQESLSLVPGVTFGSRSPSLPPRLVLTAPSQERRRGAGGDAALSAAGTW